jgi:hypothetical protein
MPTDDPSDNPLAAADEFLEAKLVSETAQVEWSALQRIFAAGKTIHVADGEDMVAIGRVIATDNADELRRLMKAKIVGPVGDATAKRWYETDALVWSVVVNPWVLVQHNKSSVE